MNFETWSLTLREERRLRVFENRVFRRIFGFKKDEVTRQWRKLHNEELNPLKAELNPIYNLLPLVGAHHILRFSGIRVNDLYCSRNIVRVLKSKRMRWTGDVARVWERRDVYRDLVGKPERKRWIFKKWDVGVWTGSSWLRIETGGGHL